MKAEGDSRISATLQPLGAIFPRWIRLSRLTLRLSFKCEIRALPHEGCEADAVDGASLAHETTNVSRHGLWSNAQVPGDLSIGLGRHDQFHHLLFAVGKLGWSAGEGGIADVEEPIDKLGKQSVRPINTTVDNHFNGLSHHIDVRVQIEVGFSSGRYGLHGQTIASLLPDYNHSELRTDPENGINRLRTAARLGQLQDQILQR